jgi:hypothetical protein
VNKDTPARKLPETIEWREAVLTVVRTEEVSIGKDRFTLITLVFILTGTKRVLTVLVRGDDALQSITIRATRNIGFVADEPLFIDFGSGMVLPVQRMD